MPKRRVVRDILTIPRGYRSGEAASFLAQLDELTERIEQDLKGLTVRDLEWQPARGMNTIGMLLAHCAIVEVWWYGGPALGRDDAPFERVLGIGSDDDGMPLAAGGRHPRALRGKSLRFYLDLLRRARRFAKRTARRWTTADLERVGTRTYRSRPVTQHFNLRWIQYHVLEHLAGHYGQMLLLLHQRRAPKRAR